MAQQQSDPAANAVYEAISELNRVLDVAQRAGLVVDIGMDEISPRQLAPGILIPGRRLNVVIYRPVLHVLGDKN